MIPLTEFPRYVLLHQPTLLQRLERTEAALERLGLYVKRDDLMPIALGGNKLRSLEYWLGAAFAEHADVVLVAGAANSNLCRLTAAAASMAGLECTVFHNCVENPETRRASFLNQIFGASVRFLGSVDEDHRAQAVEEAAGALRRQGRRPYVIGTGAIGALGYVRAADELWLQCRQLGAPVRHVLLPGSMGTTEAGFIFGNARLGFPFDVHLVSVEYDQAQLERRVREIYGAIERLFGADAPRFDASRVHYHMNYLGEGYGRPTADAEAAILTLARTEGIVLEHTYTAKNFACFLDLARGRSLPDDEPLCVIHTGGVPALFSQFSHFSSLSSTVGL